MKKNLEMMVALAAMVLAGNAVLRPANAQTDDNATAGFSTGTVDQKLVLTAAQRSAIYQAVSKDKSKVASKQFPAVVGAEVPPMIVLYALPDETVTDNASAKFYEYTVVQDKVVLVDPTKMRVVDIIGPPR